MTQSFSLDEGGAQGIAPHSLILFGATGDLSRRKLYPALFSLYRQGQLPNEFVLLGAARRPFSDDAFRELVMDSILTYGDTSSVHSASPDVREFLAKVFYTSVDIAIGADFERLRERLSDIEREIGTILPNRMFYLAVAPNYFGDIARQLHSSGLTELPGWKRLIIEKPFGRDLASAEDLNEELCSVFREDEVYRIDHYLGKEMVQNIEVLRFANSMFEPVWNNRSIANVQITSSETVGVEERAAYYDKSGALRDMVQNHMLQMVMMIAMEPPSRLKNEAIRDEKVKVLRSLRRYTAQDIHQHVIRGQYTEGTIAGHNVTGYRTEPGVSESSTTETFMAARLFIDNFRWAGVPFYIRTGKRMAVKSTEIVIQFRDMPKHLYFNEDGRLGPNLLVIRVNPVEGMYIQLNAKRPGTDSVIPVAMEFSHPQDSSREAYERLLLDAMRGDSTYFTRWDEVSLAWKFVDPIAAAFRGDASLPLHDYAAGGWGPSAAKDLPANDGFQWWPVYGENTSSVEELLEHQYGRPIGVKISHAKHVRRQHANPSGDAGVQE